MTHSLSVTGADRPPAMYRRATLAIVVSRTSMNVGTTTAAATNQGLIRGRLASGERSWVFMAATLKGMLKFRRGLSCLPFQGVPGAAMVSIALDDLAGRFTV